MDLLDEIQNKARQIRVREAEQKIELATQDEFYQTQLRPVMLRAYEYYAELIENLNIVAPDIKAAYPLNPLLDSEIPLQQGNYKIRSDNKEAPRQIDFFCRCTLVAPCKFYLPGRKAVQNHAALLENYNFTHHRKNRLDLSHNIRGATFKLEGPMIAHVRLAANPSGRNVHILFRNVERKPLNRYVFPPEAVDDELIERVAKVFIRQVPMLVDRTVDASVREPLRNQAERDEHEVTRANVKGATKFIDAENVSMILRPKFTVAERTRDLLKHFSISEA